MKITIEGSAKEIADAVLQLQRPQGQEGCDIEKVAEAFNKQMREISDVNGKRVVRDVVIPGAIKAKDISTIAPQNRGEASPT